MGGFVGVGCGLMLLYCQRCNIARRAGPSWSNAAVLCRATATQVPVNVTALSVSSQSSHHIVVAVAGYAPVKKGKGSPYSLPSVGFRS